MAFEIQDKARFVAIAVALAIIILAILGNVLGKDYKVNSIVFVIIILGIIYVAFKLIMFVEKRTLLSRQDFIVLIVVAAILMVLILILFKTKLVPDNFLGAVEGIGRFSSL